MRACDGYDVQYGVPHDADDVHGERDEGDAHAVGAYDGYGAPYGDGASHGAHDGVPPFLSSSHKII